MECDIKLGGNWFGVYKADSTLRSKLEDDVHINYQEFIANTNYIIEEELAKKRKEMERKRRLRKTQQREKNRRIVTQPDRSQPPSQPKRKANNKEDTNCSMAFYQAIQEGTRGLTEDQMYEIASGNMSILDGTRWACARAR